MFRRLPPQAPPLRSFEEKRRNYQLVDRAPNGTRSDSWELHLEPDKRAPRSSDRSEDRGTRLLFFSIVELSKLIGRAEFSLIICAPRFHFVI